MINDGVTLVTDSLPKLLQCALSFQTMGFCKGHIQNLVVIHISVQISLTKENI